MKIGGYIPQYSYQHGDGRIIDVFQSMEGKHEVWVDGEGQEWKRVWDSPNMVVESIFSINPYDAKEFSDKTGKKSGKLDDIYQLSAEMSEKRKQKDGKDFIQEKGWSRYEQQRVRGTVHPDRKKLLLKEALGKNKHFEVDVD